MHARSLVVAVLLATAAVNPVAHAGDSPCGIVVTSNFILDRDLFCPGGTAITVAASHVAVDLGGHVIAGDGTGVGIDVGRDEAIESITVSNGRVHNFEVGVEISGTSVRLTDMEFADNLWGVLHLAGRDARVTSSRFFRNRNAIHLTGGGFASRIEDNLFQRNRSAVYASEHDLTIYRNNRLSHNQVGLWMSRTRRWEISHNNFLRNWQGVVVDDSESEANRVVNNSFRENQVGLNIGGTGVADGEPVGFGQVPETIIRKNHFAHNGAAGLLILLTVGDAANSIIEDNRFIGNGYAPGAITNIAGQVVNDGLHAEGAVTSGFTVRNNLAVRNADYGIEASDVLDGGGNKARANGNPSQCVGVSC